MVEVPLTQEANQRFNITLADQDCSIRIVTRRPGDAIIPGGTYIDLEVGATPVFYGVLARDLMNLNLYPSAPFQGALIFVDLDGNEDPQYESFGVRWRLFYLTDEEAANVYSARS